MLFAGDIAMRPHRDRVEIALIAALVFCTAIQLALTVVDLLAA